MDRKYALGLDFGSLSGRALLVDVQTGDEIATAVKMYSHGFIESELPISGEKLPPDWTLQDPRDYLEVLAETIPAVLRQSNINPADIIGIGLDFTSSTCLPVNNEGTPLCFLPAFRENKHAYVKKWKHHAAQHLAHKMTEVARNRQEPFLDRYGGLVSSEWMLPKLWQILKEAPEVYQAMHRFMEAGDWLVMQLTGKKTRNSCSAGYKAFWSKRDGYPSSEYFKALDPAFEYVVDEKLSRHVQAIGGKAGELTEAGAALTGLRPGIAVAVANVDAHVAMPAVGITKPEQMLMIMGTSICHLVLSQEERLVPGICGVVEDGILPGFAGYEAGQSCVGDLFDWFITHQVPPAWHDLARDTDRSLHQVLREKAAQEKPGASGLLALDWWNGNRSVLVDVDLTGMILGMTLASRPEQIYRALLEATAYGSRKIIEQFSESGVPVSELYACGGIAMKDPLMMQIFADVTNREIKVSARKQTVALGAAMFGAVAAGKDRGGYDHILDAAAVMPALQEHVYRPIPAHVTVYDELYHEYKRLHDYFGRGENNVMKRLKAISHKNR